ncbi:hypothetical protein Tco_0066997 [Tanacetum coccineum]
MTITRSGLTLEAIEELVNRRVEEAMAAHEVLVYGSAEATEHLKQHCMKNVCSHVYAPQIEETITSDLCAYKVQISENL